MPVQSRKRLYRFFICQRDHNPQDIVQGMRMTGQLQISDKHSNINIIMKEIQIFKNEDFGQIRIILDDNGEPLFCLSDVCKALDLEAPNVKRRISDGMFSKHSVKDIRGRKNLLIFVNEDGLYDTIFDSRKPEARKFRKWVTSDVLPSIRKHGAYATDDTIERIMKNPDFGISLLSALKQERIARQNAEGERLMLTRKIDEIKPMADYCAMVLTSKQTVTITQIAQDYGYSARAFNELLRDMNVQFRQNEQWILYASFKTMGYVQSNTVTYLKYDGSQGAKMYTRWTQQGRLFIYHKLKKEGILPLIERDNYSAPL